MKNKNLDLSKFDSSLCSGDVFLFLEENNRFTISVKNINYNNSIGLKKVSNLISLKILNLKNKGLKQYTNHNLIQITIKTMD